MKSIITLCTFLFIVTCTFAQKTELPDTTGKKTQDKTEVRQDKTDDKQDKNEIKQDTTEVKQDKTEVKEDKSETRLDTTEVKQDKTEVKEDKSETRLDTTEVKQDKTEVKEDKSETRQDTTNVKQDKTEVKVDKSETGQDTTIVKQDKIEIKDDKSEVKKDDSNVEDGKKEGRENQVEEPGKQNSEKKEIRITPGASGVKRSIGYKFSSITRDGDPGDGIFRYNNFILPSVTYIFVNKKDIKGEDQTNWYRTWKDSTGATGRGQLMLAETAGKIVNIFDITDSFIDAGGYWKIPVKYVSGKLPVNDYVYYYVFNRIAHKVGDNQGRQDETGKETTKEIVAEQGGEGEQVTEVSEPEKVEEVKEAEKVEEIKEPEKVEEVIEPEKVEEVKEAEKVEEVKEAEKVEEVKVVEKVEEVKEAEKVEEVKEGEKVEEVREAEKVEEVKETEKVEEVKEAEKVEEVKEIEKVEQDKQQPYEVQDTKKIPVTPPAREISGNQVPPTQNYYGTTGGKKRKCYRGIIELGYALRISEYGLNNFRFNFINGFNIGPTSFGLGIGVRKYYDQPSKHPDWTLVSSDIQIPVFLDIRTHFSSKKVTPYLALGIGNSEGFDTDTSQNKPEGLFLHSSAGVWFNISDRFAIFTGFAYEMQRLEYALVSDEIPFKKYTNSVSFNIGIAF